MDAFGRSQRPQVLTVRTPDGRTLRFSRTFVIGRDAACDVHLGANEVSRRHLEVTLVAGQWVLRDLQSRNGTFLDDQQIHELVLDAPVRVRLGSGGPTVEMVPQVEAPARSSLPAPGATSSVDSEDVRLMLEGDDEQAGERTRIFRRAYRQSQQKQQQLEQQHARQRRWYFGIVAVLVASTLAVGGYAIHSRRQLGQQKAAAEDMFYEIRSAEVRTALLIQELSNAGKSLSEEQLRRYLAERQALEQKYDVYVQQHYSRRLSQEDLLILRVTRQLGECDVDAPEEYLAQVKRFIGQWRSTSRFRSAVDRAKSRGYTQRIVAELLRQNLPPQFFYLAMQESSFDPVISGPPTRWGYAKGMWQFIPDTGERYGLKRGPLSGQPVPDAADDRHNWEKATVAAARYIRDIYATDAQASGLLVMASYNMGENQVVSWLRQMPQNPRERNFWRLITRHRIPDETYNYVFSIVSAAVIGENPRLFGMDFDNPLAF